MDPGPKQTFGIEVEFLLLANRREFSTHFGLLPDEECEKAVGRVIRRDPSIPLWPSSDIPIPKRERFSKWNVGSDCSIGLKYDEYCNLKPDWNVIPVEIQSRIFDYHEDDWKTEIQRVFKLLHSAFNDPARSNVSRIVVNSTCGLHVHVAKGAQSTKPHHLQTLKNLYCFAAGFERIIDEAHDVARLTRLFNAQEHYCEGPCYLWNDDGGKARYKLTHPLQYVAHVDETVKVRSDLPLLGSNQHCHAYNFENSFGDTNENFDRFTGRPQTGTVEFRQHRGTLDTMEMIAWVEVVTAMMSWAEIHFRPQALRFIAENLERPDYHLPDLLHDIGAGTGLVEYFKASLAPGVEWDRAQARIDAVPLDCPIKELIYVIEDKRWHLKDFHAVRRAIGTKLQSGTLGYFPRKMLEGLPGEYWSGSDASLELAYNLDQAYDSYGDADEPSYEDDSYWNGADEPSGLSRAWQEAVSDTSLDNGW